MVRYNLCIFLNTGTVYSENLVQFPLKSVTLFKSFFRYFLDLVSYVTSVLNLVISFIVAPHSAEYYALI